jgi:hypothetical protein
LWRASQRKKIKRARKDIDIKQNNDEKENTHGKTFN